MLLTPHVLNKELSFAAILVYSLEYVRLSIPMSHMLRVTVPLVNWVLV